MDALYHAKCHAVKIFIFSVLDIFSVRSIVLNTKLKLIMLVFYIWFATNVVNENNFTNSNFWRLEPQQIKFRRSVHLVIWRAVEFPSKQRRRLFESIHGFKFSWWNPLCTFWCLEPLKSKTQQMLIGWLLHNLQHGHFWFGFPAWGAFTDFEPLTHFPLIFCQDYFSRSQVARFEVSYVRWSWLRCSGRR